MDAQSIRDMISIFVTVAPYALVWALALRITQFVIGCMSGKKVSDV